MLSTAYFFRPLNHPYTNTDDMPENPAAVFVNKSVDLLSQIYTWSTVEIKGSFSFVSSKPLAFHFNEENFTRRKRNSKCLENENPARCFVEKRKTSSRLVIADETRREKKLAVYQKETAVNFILILPRKKILVL